MLGIILNTVGILGVILMLLAYLLLEHGTLKDHDKIYLMLNIVGPAGIIASLYIDWNLPAFLIEFAWILVSIYGFLRRPKIK